MGRGSPSFSKILTLTISLVAFACSMSFAQAEKKRMKILYEDGSEQAVDLSQSSDRIKTITFEGAGPGGFPPPGAMILDQLDSLQLIKAVTRKETSAFRSRPRQDLSMQTGSGDRTPSIMAELTSETLILQSPRRLTLAGDPNGANAWGLDNFLLIEILDLQGQVIRRAVIGNTEPVFTKGEQIPQIGPNQFEFPPRLVEATSLIPLNQPFKLKVTALDYGG